MNRLMPFLPILLLYTMSLRIACLETILLRPGRWSFNLHIK